MGINRQLHYRLASEERWHQLGDRLAPKEGWNGVLGGRPGMASVEILAKRDDAEVPLRIKVQPSVRVVPHGVYFETNEHYDAPAENGLRHLLDILRDRWEPAQGYAERIAKHILHWTNADTE